MSVARTPAGGAIVSRGKFYMRITTAPKTRPAKLLPWCTALADAEERAHAVQALVNTLRAAGEDTWIANVLDVGSTANGDELAALARNVARIVDGKVEKAPSKGGARAETFRGIGEDWTSGKLHRLHRDHVRDKKSANDDAYRLELLCETGIGDLRVADLTLDDADRAMQDLDEARQRVEVRRAKERGATVRTLAALEPGGRRQYAQMISRICAMAVYPLRLIKVSPIPKGWLPRVPNDKAKGLVYPSEETTFLADTTIPIHWRVFFGALARLGFRADEAAGLTIANVDTARGIITLDENKTDDPRAPTYAAVPGFIEALTWWRDTYRAGAADDAPFFIQPNGERIRVDGLAHRYRTLLEGALRAAGTYRADLFVGGERRMKVRAHDLRGAFVTYALASGRTETWVMDRTGHRSSHMVNRYRRVARTVEESGLGDLAPLDQSLPESSAATATAAALAVAEPKSDTAKATARYQNHSRIGPIAQSVELRTFNRNTAQLPTVSRDDSTPLEDTDRASEALLPRFAPAATAEAVDPVEGALAGAIEAIAGRLASASPADLLTLVDRMQTLASELAARREAHASKGSNVVSLDRARRGST